MGGMWKGRGKKYEVFVKVHERPRMTAIDKECEGVKLRQKRTKNFSSVNFTLSCLLCHNGRQRGGAGYKRNAEVRMAHNEF